MLANKREDGGRFDIKRKLNFIYDCIKKRGWRDILFHTVIILFTFFVLFCFVLKRKEKGKFVSPCPELILCTTNAIFFDDLRPNLSNVDAGHIVTSFRNLHSAPDPSIIIRKTLMTLPLLSNAFYDDRVLLGAISTRLGLFTNFFFTIDKQICIWFHSGGK